MTAFPDIVKKHAPRKTQYPMPPGPQVSSSGERRVATRRIRVRSAATAASTWPTWSPTSALALTVIPDSRSPATIAA